MPDQIQSKIFTLDNFKDTLSEWRNENQSCVFTNGVFDILHKGHIDYLYKASLLGDKLILGLNADSSVKRLGKGDDRPINSEDDRAYLLAAFFFIDAVVLFDSDTPYQLISTIKPDVLVKGGDYDPRAKEGDKKYIVGSDYVLSAGGKVDVIPFLPGYSTTSLINKIRNASL
jgi:rfaE bifunctional protein nucleotidyltransferase chain/domain